MGAVTAIMYGDKDPSISALVLDSPFSSLKTVVTELAQNQINMPGFVLSAAISIVSKSVKERANFKIKNLETVYYAKRCFMPGLFCTGKSDTFVRPHHSKLLYEIYPGEKSFLEVEGDHNSLRPKILKDTAASFFYTTMQVENIKGISDMFCEVHRQKLLEIEKKNKLINEKLINHNKVEESRNKSSNIIKQIHNVVRTTIQQPNQNVKIIQKPLKESKIHNYYVTKDDIKIGQIMQQKRKYTGDKNDYDRDIMNNCHQKCRKASLDFNMIYQPQSQINSNVKNKVVKKPSITDMNLVVQPNQLNQQNQPNQQINNKITNIYGIKNENDEEEVLRKILEYSKMEAEKTNKTIQMVYNENQTIENWEIEK